MTSLGPLLNSMMKKMGLYGRERQHRAMSVWNRVVGPAVSAHAQPRSVDGQTLVVVTSDPAWAQQIAFMKTDIIERINREVGGPQPVVTGIRTYTGQVDAGPNRDEPGSPAKATGGGGVSEPLDPDRRALIREVWEKSLGLETPVRRKLVALATLKIKRDAFLVRLGWVPCPRCGSATRLPRQTSANVLCPSCQVEREPVLRYVERLLSEAPWLDYDGVVALEPRCTREDYQMVREALARRWRKDVSSRAADEGWLTRAVALVMLIQGKPVDSLDASDFVVLRPGQARRALELLGMTDVSPGEEGST